MNSEFIKRRSMKKPGGRKRWIQTKEHTEKSERIQEEGKEADGDSILLEAEMETVEEFYS